MNTNVNGTTAQQAVPPSPIDFFNPNVDPAVFSDEQALESASYILQYGEVCDDEAFAMNFIAGREAAVRNLLTRKRAKKLRKLVMWRMNRMEEALRARVEQASTIDNKEDAKLAVFEACREFARLVGRGPLPKHRVDIATASKKTKDAALCCAAWVMDGMLNAKTVNEAIVKYDLIKDENAEAVINHVTFALFGVKWADVEAFMKEAGADALKRNVPIYTMSYREALKQVGL